MVDNNSKKLPSREMRECESRLRRMAEEAYIRYHAEELQREALKIRKKIRNVRRYIQKIE